MERIEKRLTKKSPMDNKYHAQCSNRELVNRLAEYENTGLTPQGVELAKLTNRGFMPMDGKHLPPEDIAVLVQISGKGNNVTYEHAPVIGSYYGPEEGWTIWSDKVDEFVVEAWATIPIGLDVDSK